MSVHVFLNLFNELGKRDKCNAYRAFCLFFPNLFNKFNDTGARMFIARRHITHRRNVM